MLPSPALPRLVAVTNTASPGQRIQSVDGLRAVAFLAVFAFHTWEFAGRPEIPVLSSVVSQNIRPDFFVVLTGFVLFLPFARRPERMDEFQTRTYLWRRMRRMVIPYYVALVVRRAPAAAPRGAHALVRSRGVVAADAESG